jgi:ElaB/YqjD/DUF883 family membrane-anchored ribosome-binding protein
MSRHKSRFALTCLIAAALTEVSCASKVRDVMYSAYEKVGIQKRDLLKKRITTARNDQKEAGATFTDALDKLRAVYKVDGGELEKRYDKLKSSYDKATSDAKAVHDSIGKVETVAGDLFKEWEKEDSEIQAADLRAKSRAQLNETRQRYEAMVASLKQAESRMQPVLAAFKDQTLFMKHNLNAQAIASLKSETTNIEKNINQLIERMNQSIKEADDFIARLP